MSSRKILFLTLFLAIVAVLLHFSAETFYFYWSYWWFDVLMHFLVGLTGGLGIYWGLFESGLIFRKRFKLPFVLISVLFCVLAVGLAWEFYEFYFKINNFHEGYLRDTLNDVTLDTAGALLAVALGYKKR